MTIGIDTLPGLTKTRMNDRCRLYGANGSPSSVKVRAYTVSARYTLLSSPGRSATSSMTR